MSPTSRLRSLMLACLLASAAGCEGEVTELPTDPRCVDQSALRLCPAGSLVKGIDVSYYQGTINWTTAKNSGQVFAITRVSDGLNYPDSKFIANWTGMKSAGVIRGVYQFFRPAQDPIAQADYLLAQLQAHGRIQAGDLPAVLDLEATDGQTNAVVVAKAQAWLDRVEAGTGRRPMVYTAAFMSPVIGSNFSTYPLWVANYGATCPLMPGAWSTWRIWQYDDKGSVPGVGGTTVDMNEFNGTLAELVAFTNSGFVDAGTPPADAGSTVDAGHVVADAGTPDAGAADAGMNFDAGSTTDDAGLPPDAGQPTADAGGEPVGPTDLDAGAVMGSGRPDPAKLCSP